MSSRLYDYIITVSDASGFVPGNNFIGQSSNTYGYIANVDVSSGNIKVRVSNALQEFSIGETVKSNSTRYDGTYSYVREFPNYNNNTTVTTTNTLYTGKDWFSLLNKNTVFSKFLNLFKYSSTTDQGTGSASITSFELPLTGDLVPRYSSELSVYVNSRQATSDQWTYNTSNTSIRFYSYANVASGSNIKVVRTVNGNPEIQPLNPAYTQIGNTVTTASTTITAVNNSPFIRSRFSFEQSPIVRLYSVYYPGEWYPPNSNGNPGSKGAGYSWPADMPWRVAEVIGDIHSDLSYNVTFDGDSYIAYPINSSGIGVSGDGTIDEVTLTVSNYDGVITAFVEDPYLVGNVTSNSAQGYVNGELVYGLDPRTVTGNTHYDQDIVDTYYGKANSPWIYSQAIAQGEDWNNLKYDSRDLLGGVVEIKSTFAHHLEYWPEHSRIEILRANVATVINGAPYRVGDTVVASSNSTQVSIQAIEEGNILFFNAPLPASEGDSLYIVNSEADPEAFVKDVFKITELAGLDEKKAELRLTSWLQYFKLQLPRRKYYKNTCQWEYKGTECQYPGPNGGSIPGSIPVKQANTNPITISNEIGASADEDECSKSYQACKLRNNTIHFGGFPGTGRQIPKQ